MNCRQTMLLGLTCITAIGCAAGVAKPTYVLNATAQDQLMGAAAYALMDDGYQVEVQDDALLAKKVERNDDEGHLSDLVFRPDNGKFVIDVKKINPEGRVHDDVARQMEVANESIAETLQNHSAEELARLAGKLKEIDSILVTAAPGAGCKPVAELSASVYGAVGPFGGSRDMETHTKRVRRKLKMQAIMKGGDSVVAQQPFVSPSAFVMEVTLVGNAYKCSGAASN